MKISLNDSPNKMVDTRIRTIADSTKKMKVGNFFFNVSFSV